MDRRRVPKIFAGVAFDRMNPPKRVKLESFGASKVQIEELSIENEKLKEENERLRATIGDLDDQVFRMRSAFHRCQSFDAGLAGKTKEERSCFRTTTGLSPPSFIKLCNVCADDLPSRLNGSWEGLCFLLCIAFELDCRSISCRANIWSLRAPCQVATGRQWNFLGAS
jgi:hypothetical protein